MWPCYIIQFINRYDIYLAIFGFLCFLVLSYRILCDVLKEFRAFILNHFFPQNLSKYGRWAVITGATDGIGKAYARELARRNLNIILISRNWERLKTTAEELENEYGVKTAIVQADFSVGMKLYHIIRQEIQDKNIGILVNNVGQQFSLPCKYLELTPTDLVQLININMVSMLIMTDIILRVMVPKRDGYIINVSSLSSIKPLPLMSIYSASKAFMTFLSQSLYYEQQPNNIMVQCLIPSYVSTKLIDFSSYFRKSTRCVPNANQYASSAVNTVGVFNLTTGYWSHELQRKVYERVPTWLWNTASLYALNKLDSRNYKNTS